MPDQPSSRRRFQFRLRTLMIGVTVLCVYFGWNRLHHFSIAANNVVSMKVILESPHKEIDVPGDEIASLIAALADARRDWSPAKWEDMGGVQCQMKSGEITCTDLFYVDAQEIALRTEDGHYFRGVDAKKLLSIIDAAAQAAKPSPAIGNGAAK